jgi:hypothetical protein
LFALRGDSHHALWLNSSCILTFVSTFRNQQPTIRSVDSLYDTLDVRILPASSALSPTTRSDRAATETDVPSND